MKNKLEKLLNKAVNFFYKNDTYLSKINMHDLKFQEDNQVGEFFENKCN